MKSFAYLWLAGAFLLAVSGCNRTDVEDDEEPPVNVVRPEAIITHTSNVAVPLTNLPAETTNR